MIFRWLITLFTLLALASCSKPKYGGESIPPVVSGEVSIAYLKSLCSGSHYRIVDDYTICGTVVATDWLGELHNSAIIVDSSGGLEFAIECDNINEHIPIYSKVEIFCNGLSLARIGGKIELGVAPTDDFPLGNIDESMFERYIRVVGVCDDFTPPTKSFNDIKVSDICNIVRFDNVRISDEEQGLAWCDSKDEEPLTTYRTLVNRDGDSLAVRTLATSKYALEKMPTKEISVVGAIDYANNRYFLRIVNKWFI